MLVENNYIFEGYEFLTTGLNCRVYDDQWHKGITYNLPEGTFDLSFNKIGWARILINYSNGSWKDLPFNSGTLSLLPETIKFKKITEKLMQDNKVELVEKFDVTKFFKTLPVLDKGHVELCDGMICDPKLKIVNAARVSFQKETSELTEKDIKLINFLFKHEHFSTFRHSYFSFRIKAPLLVFRQFWKYQIGCDWVENENVGTIQVPETNWNEVSGRYVEFQPEFYIPEEIRKQSKDNKQGSEGKLSSLVNGEDPVQYFEQSCNSMYEKYEYLVKSGAAKEQARSLLPQNIYSECMWTCSLQCVLYVLHQRLKSDAQFEIRQYAKAIAELILPILRPLNISMENI